MRGVKLELKPTIALLKKRNLETGGKVQKYIDSEVLRHSDPYTPILSGALRRSGILHTEIGSGEVVYKTPYARFIYYGDVMVGRQTGSPWAQKNESKIVTGRKLKYHGGAEVGPKWFERMKANHRDDILRGAAKVSGGRVK